MAPVEPSSSNSQGVLNDYIKKHAILIFSKSTCGYCKKVKDLFTTNNITFTAVDLDKLANGAELHKVLAKMCQVQTVPCVFISGKLIGGYNDVVSMHKRDELLPLVLKAGGATSSHPSSTSNESVMPPDKSAVPADESAVPAETYEYDLVVIGGGSGGLASAKESSDLGAKVACVDFVTPSEQGSTWGLGGTCVNVGCIPKKLMHQAAILGHSLSDAREFGWEFDKNVRHNWETLTTAVQDHIGGLNWNYRVQLRSKSVTYVNAFAKFVGPHKIKCTGKGGKVTEMTAKYFIIATGGRPRYPYIPGAKKYCITSDDLFSLPSPPGKTLVIGASYVSLECAGFLGAFGYDVTVMVRSILLRGFDQQMADQIGQYMQTEGHVKFIRGCVPTKVEKIETAEHKLRVTATKDDHDIIEDYDTVMVAVGRDPCTREIGLDQIGVKTDQKTGFILASDAEQTSCPYVYAIGDVLAGRPELTPVAIQAGKLLARRLFTSATLKCDYINIPTTVFTPIEYGAIGLAEEDAIAKYGDDDIDVYHANYFPLEWTVPHKTENICYAKLICIKSQQNRVIGFHVLGPNAGEMTQGFALGMKMGATKEQFDSCIGIHPTCAEVFTKLAKTKASGADVSATGC